MPLSIITDQTIFPFLNVVIVGYILLAICPKWKFTSIVTLVLPGVYSALYFALVVNYIMTNESSFLLSINFGELDAVIALFKDPAVIMAGWTHYIAFDLLVARFIVLDAAESGISHYIILPLIPVSLFLGPVAYCLYSLLKISSFCSTWLTFDSSMYFIVSCLCGFMLFWIVIFPSSMRLAIGSSDSINAHNTAVEQVFALGTFPTPITTITKYYNEILVILTHISPSFLWVLLIPFQLNDKIRRAYPFIHRCSGYLLLTAVLFISLGVFIIGQKSLTFENDYPSLKEIRSGFSEWGLSPFNDSFTAMKLFFYGLAVYFDLSLIIAVYHATKKDYVRHKIWIIRHISSGIWVALQRTYLLVRSPTALSVQRAAFYDGAIISAVLSMIIAEVYIYISRSTTVNRFVEDRNKSD